MVALRRVAVLLIVLTLAVISSGLAQAQTGLVTCTATAVPPVVRAEGIAELVGDIVLTCFPTIGSPAQPVFQTNISVALNVNVTNNIEFTTPDTITDAVLVINENNCTTPSTVGSVISCGNPLFQDPQFGRLADVNRLEWDEVLFPFPGAETAPGSGIFYPSITTVRVTSMRANASQLGVPDQATFPSTQITAFVSITGPTTIPISNNVLNVAVPILGLIVTIDDVITGLQCLDTEGHTFINLKEGFATSFKTLGVPTFLTGRTQWESGYYAPGSNNGGGASQPTRFLIRFFNIPEGLTVEVPKVIDHVEAVPVDTDHDPDTPPILIFPDETGDALRIRLVSGADANGAGGNVTGGTDNETVSISGGFGSVTYEVEDADPFRIEDCDVWIWFSWEADTVNDSPAVGSGQVSATFAPLSTVVVADDGEPEPRFIDTGGDPTTIISIIRCTTTLLFPFVTNRSDFDTGIAISNTSKDWLGTDPQSGACTLHYHGSTTGGGAAPPDQTSTVIAGGEQLILTLSGGSPTQNIAGAPEFQGYIIAVCEFQYGHGFAFLTDGFGGIPALAQGYLALVIPTTDGGNRVAGVPNLHLFGESLSH